MTQAEYYPKQNVVSLNIQLSSWAKAFLNDLRTSKNLLSYTKASISIEKKKKIGNSILYKIKLRLLYDSSSNRPDVSVEREKWNQRSSPLDDSPGGNEARCDFPLPQGKGSFCNRYTNPKGGNESGVICKEEKETRKSSEKANNFEGNYGVNGSSPPPEYAKQEGEGRRGTTYTPLGVGHQRGRSNHTKGSTQERGKLSTNNPFDVDHLLRGRNTFSKDFPLLERAHLAKYLLLPSSLSVQSAKIKSIHFVLSEKLSVCVLLDLIVVRKKKNLIQPSINKELQDMLKMQRSTVQCKFCSEGVITCGGVNFILPNLYLNTADFLEHAFCEECTTFSFDGLKDVDRTIFLFPNCLFFHLSLVKESHLAVKADSLHHFRFLLFCNFCHNSLGYMENQRSYTYSYIENKNMSDKLKDVFLGSLHEGDQGGYTHLDAATTLLRCGDRPSVHFNEGGANVVPHLDVAPGGKQHGGGEANDVPPSEEIIHERKQTEVKATQNDNTARLMAHHRGGLLNPCGETPPKVYLLKHKIKMTLNGENIFKNYDHVLFLNEYMHNKCEKKNTTLFYLRSNQKRKVIEVRIFIRTLYICKIWDDAKDLSKFLGLQKVMKIFFCTKGECEFKFANSETIDLSRELYEDVLKMLVAYSFRGCAPGAKLFSYLHLVH
ncbi:hypothetical protein PVIIG_00052 [Plasmodium vivax India VII]|uniref:Uncharacterized protein n=1 Tax=Plasmodium vivax India VII TaxID=1077284 RepID=A0A0J9S9L8_PLAVI|nr:hypothetical protein PVIIG_00052 [Plasmodium vivax India VII]